MSVRSRPSIDYLGAGVLAGALSAIVLVASLGGTTWAWGSPQVVLVGAAGVLLFVVFVLVERRAREPVLPIALLRDEVFRVAGLLSLIVGFALFGSVTFLPLFFQTVFHSSPTGAGLRLIPLMGGLLLTSVVSGRLISRTGRYRLFPIAGTAVMAVGLMLLSRLQVMTSSVEADGYLLVLGLGLGLVMQVLVLAVQNAVDYSVLGAATSGVTLARGVGGSIGAAVFGTIFSSRLRSGLHGVLAGPLGAQVSGGGRLTGAQVATLPGAARLAYENAYVHALEPGLPGGGGDRGVWLPPQPAPEGATAARDRLHQPGTGRCAGGAEEPELAGRDRSGVGHADRTRCERELQRARRRPCRSRAQPRLDLGARALWQLRRCGHS